MDQSSDLATAPGVLPRDPGAARESDPVGGAEMESLDEALVQRLGTQFSDSGSPEAGISVLRDLLRIETRRPRFHRLLRVWVGKLTAAVRAGSHVAVR